MKKDEIFLEYEKDLKLKICRASRHFNVASSQRQAADLGKPKRHVELGPSNVREAAVMRDTAENATKHTLAYNADYLECWLRDAGSTV